MRTKSQIAKDYEAFNDVSQENISTYAKNRTALTNKIINPANADEFNATAGEIVNSVGGFFSSGGDIEFSGLLYRFTYDPTNPTFINLTVRSKLKAEVKYVRTARINADENFINNVGEVFLNAALEIFSIEQANNNIKELNEILANICKENEIPYTFGFTVLGSSSSIVEKISDSEVIFNASIAAAHGLSEFSLCQAGDEYSDYVQAHAIEIIVGTLKTIPTTVKLIKSKVSIIKALTGISTKKRATKLIRGAYHKNARYITKQKMGTFYYNETVSINGADVNVFALVEKDEAGNVSVVLAPFDATTGDNVNFDVIAAIKEFA